MTPNPNSGGGRCAPKRIYLQVCDEDGLRWDEGDETWCRDRIHRSDVAYVRADTIKKRKAAK